MRSAEYIARLTLTSWPLMNLLVSSSRLATFPAVCTVMGVSTSHWSVSTAARPASLYRSDHSVPPGLHLPRTMLARAHLHSEHGWASCQPPWPAKQPYPRLLRTADERLEGKDIAGVGVGVVELIGLRQAVPKPRRVLQALGIGVRVVTVRSGAHVPRVLRLVE
eukprot:scaffold102818_cov36-Phaeocystis_antarctica.AAC.1